MTSEPEGPFDELALPELPELPEAELIGYGWMPVWLDVIRTLALVVIAVAVCVR